MEPLRWLSEAQVRELGDSLQLPCYLYSEKELRQQIADAKSFPVNAGYGFVLRYAMKANPTKAVLEIMRDEGVNIDASSEWEVFRAMRLGFQPARIQLTAQQHATRFKELMDMGISFTACSVRQLEEFGKWFEAKCATEKLSPQDAPFNRLGIRVNPGMGSGETAKTNVGGAQSAFGIWHEQLDQVQAIVTRYQMKITTVHTHIGSGSDPAIWEDCAKLSLACAARFSDTCEILNLGGGFKVGRMSDEKTTNLQLVGEPIKKLFVNYFEKYGRQLTLEIEPGSFYTVNMGVILSNVDDSIDTGAEGFKFLKLNIGMDNILRPSLYGARHPMTIVPKTDRVEEVQTADYIVAGHCCESGDLLTQALGGAATTRTLRVPQIGDYVVIGGTGAYCSSMAAGNYNSFPEAPEYLLALDGSVRMVRKPQTLEQVWENEL